MFSKGRGFVHCVQSLSGFSLSLEHSIIRLLWLFCFVLFKVWKLFLYQSFLNPRPGELTSVNLQNQDELIFMVLEI